MRLAILLTLSTLALSGSMPATAQRQSGPSCNLTASQAGLAHTGRMNVRAAPSAGARLLRSLAGEISPVATIREQRGAWFRVSLIVDYENEEQVLFRGDGWVHQSNLGTSIANADPRLYPRPSRQSRPIARLVPDESQVTLIGCSGTWAQVRYRRQVGWLSRDGQCSNPLTTCP